MSHKDILQDIFSSCRRILGKQAWGRIRTALDESTNPQAFLNCLPSLKDALHLPTFIDDLAKLEWARHRTTQDKADLTQELEKPTVNPTLSLVPVSWKNLGSLIGDDGKDQHLMPEPGQCRVIIWRHPKTGKLQMREAEDADLLALKMVAEELDPRDVAAVGQATVRVIHTALDQATAQGILMSPGSRIRRAAMPALQEARALEPFLTADIFTLQWHITQACDLHCRHCYDRSERLDMPYKTAVAVLDDFYEFCNQMHVRGQVTFTGGNPLLYSNFIEIYQAASDRGFGVAILGNPTPRDQMERLLGIAKPVYFQISLEGMAAYNDFMRGPGHFQRSLDFLALLRRMDIYTMVMLTLMHDNLDQVLPLSRLLENRADFFTFNRLSTVGEGKHLSVPRKKDFEMFLRGYEAAAGQSPVMGLKDNLINILRKERGAAPFGGCTGHGCGAAFNFVALLSNGEVHACRKFPSPIGNLMQSRLVEIYQSDLAEKYRRGSEACQDCRLNAVCRGCLAVTYSHGLNVFKDRDPFCWLP